MQDLTLINLHTANTIMEVKHTSRHVDLTTPQILHLGQLNKSVTRCR